jgi:PBP1b-binding outer membrane lipoprotein LpoB
MHKNRTPAFVALLVTLAVVVSGCSSPAQKEAVVTHGLPITQQHQKTVAIRAQGGSDTGAMDLPSISNSDLSAAIEQSIIENGLFTQVIHGDDSDYLLSVTIVNMTRPMFGASFTVTMEAAWSLSEQGTSKVVMRDSIESHYTATMGQALVGATRLRLAVEGAVRENIKSGLINISKLQLD